MDNGKKAVLPYNRVKAVEYAHKWAFGRNPKYFNFDKLGGDCTNLHHRFCCRKQCNELHSVYGWYYIDANRRSPSWTGVTTCTIFW